MEFRSKVFNIIFLLYSGDELANYPAPFLFLVLLLFYYIGKKKERMVKKNVAASVLRRTKLIVECAFVFLCLSWAGFSHHFCSGCCAGG